MRESPCLPGAALEQAEEVAVMSSENIYQMFTRLGGAGFFVKRNSWSHPRAFARVISVGGLETGPLPGTPPYHNTPDGKKLKVLAAISYHGERAVVQQLTSPGTFAYSQIDRPERWQE